MNIKAFNLTEIGSSHLINDSECQDFSISYCDEDLQVAAVSDGHGGNDYVRSSEGSEFASQIALKNIKEFVQYNKAAQINQSQNSFLNELERIIVMEWNEKVSKHFKDNPLSEEEKKSVSPNMLEKYEKCLNLNVAYGATLIAAAFTDDYWFATQIGDGKCVILNNNGEFSLPVSDDSRCQFNFTTSMCDSRAYNNFRHYYSDTKPVAVFVCTDGVENSFKNEEGLFDLYKAFLYDTLENGIEESKEGLKKFLPVLTKKGSGDDLSISGLIDIDALGNIDCIMNYNENEAIRKVNGENRGETVTDEEIKSEEEVTEIKISSRKEIESDNDMKADCDKKDPFNKEAYSDKEADCDKKEPFNKEAYSDKETDCDNEVSPDKKVNCDKKEPLNKEADSDKEADCDNEVSPEKETDSDKESESDK